MRRLLLSMKEPEESRHYSLFNLRGYDQARYSLSIGRYTGNI